MDLRLKFNEDEANYDKWRPSYVPELFEEIITCGSKILRFAQDDITE